MKEIVLCSKPDCVRFAKTRGMCATHYRKWCYAQSTNQCSIDGCEKIVWSHTWCKMHVTRWERHGDPLVTRKRHRITQENFTEQLRKMANGCWEWTGAIGDVGYGATSFQGKTCRAHCLAWFFHTGKKADLLVLHHCDNRKCCNPDHLYEGTYQDNANDRMKRGIRVGRFYKNAGQSL